MTSTKWADMNRADFDTRAPLCLFDMAEVDNSTHVRPDDKSGTPDLFAALDPFTLNEDEATLVHASFAGAPLCGWMADSESVTTDVPAITCKDCLAALDDE